MSEMKFKFYCEDMAGIKFSFERTLDQLLNKGIFNSRIQKIFAKAQFTGLTDKNGKEIYEGDILNNSAATWVVIFNSGCFCHKPIGTIERPVELALRSLVDGEIIGNIYENPEKAIMS